MYTWADAIHFEEDAERYYTEQARRFAGEPIEPMLLQLARVEKRHAELIRQRAEDADADIDLARETETLYSRAEDMHSTVRPVPDQLEVYMRAAELEQKSIDLYERLLAEAKADAEEDKLADTQLLEWLIEQEVKHRDLFENLVELLQKGKEHVEDAEFANPPEY